MDIVKRGVQCFFDGTPFKIILTLLSFNSLTAHTSFLTVLSLVVTALGGIVFIYRVVFLKRFIKTPNLLFLGLFLVSFIVTALINWKYGILGSVKVLHGWDSNMDFCMLVTTQKIQTFIKESFIF